MASWTDLTFAFESLLTSTKMTQLDNNFDALAEGASGAPKIQPAALNDTGDYTMNKLTINSGQNFNYSAPKTKYYYLTGADFIEEGSAYGSDFMQRTYLVDPPIFRIIGRRSSSPICAGALIKLPVGAVITAVHADIYVNSSMAMLNVRLYEVAQDGLMTQKAAALFSGTLLGGIWRTVGTSLGLTIADNKTYEMRLLFSTLTFSEERVNMIRITYTVDKVLD